MTIYPGTGKYSSSFGLTSTKLQPKPEVRYVYAELKNNVTGRTVTDSVRVPYAGAPQAAEVYVQDWTYSTTTTVATVKVAANALGGYGDVCESLCNWTLYGYVSHTSSTRQVLGQVMNNHWWSFNSTVTLSRQLPRFEYLLLDVTDSATQTLHAKATIDLPGSTDQRVVEGQDIQAVIDAWGNVKDVAEIANGICESMLVWPQTSTDGDTLPDLYEACAIAAKGVYNIADLEELIAEMSREAEAKGGVSAQIVLDQAILAAGNGPEQLVNYNNTATAQAISDDKSSLQTDADLTAAYCRYWAAKAKLKYVGTHGEGPCTDFSILALGSSTASVREDVINVLGTRPKLASLTAISTEDIDWAWTSKWDLVPCRGLDPQNSADPGCFRYPLHPSVESKDQTEIYVSRADRGQISTVNTLFRDFARDYPTGSRRNIMVVPVINQYDTFTLSR